MRRAIWATASMIRGRLTKAASPPTWWARSSFVTGRRRIDPPARPRPAVKLGHYPRLTRTDRRDGARLGCKTDTLHPEPLSAIKQLLPCKRPSHGSDFVGDPGQQEAPPGKLGRNVARRGEQIVTQRLQPKVDNEIARIAAPAARLGVRRDGVTDDLGAAHRLAAQGVTGKLPLGPQ